jgi:cyclophilin family peptidyl-prolyl cis-trans isomerase
MYSRVLIGLLGLLTVLSSAGCPRTDGSEASGSTTHVITTTPSETTPATPGTPGATNPATPPGTTPGTTPPAAGEATPPGTPATPPAEGTPQATPPAGTSVVVLETTKGNIELTVHDEWAPIGAKHFLELVDAKFYDGAPWFRVIDVPADPADPTKGMRPFVAQCGVAADPALNQAWAGKTIQDEPVVKGNLPGTVCFGKSRLPNSRSTHIFVNLGDNSKMLDPQGFACFAEVTSGMEVASKLSKAEFQDQGGLAQPGGLDAFKKMFPNADYITKAYVKK